ncbi:hypothetical protein ID866_13394 [Astraeus odoratus]|nr:hypothetical protein ID866_13394 [Astraeus odoratus]
MATPCPRLTPPHLSSSTPTSTWPCPPLSSRPPPPLQTPRPPTTIQMRTTTTPMRHIHIRPRTSSVHPSHDCMLARRPRPRHRSPVLRRTPLHHTHTHIHTHTTSPSPPTRSLRRTRRRSPRRLRTSRTR